MKHWYTYKLVLTNEKTVTGRVTAENAPDAVDTVLKYERILPDLITEISVEQQEKA